MTERISEPSLENTEVLLGQILSTILVDHSRVAFLVPAGTSYHVLARIRTMISRKRRALIARGKKARRFRLSSSVHQETHDGKRYDCIVLWKEISDMHVMGEMLEDMLANG